ncbi:MAG: hypothetical protein EOO88_01150 [Pedobacter sp.]|nr:MAG: hypothetical protein EOO88_01150 [Pedobacter sp.]
MQVHESRAWIFLALAMASNGKPADVKAISAAAEGIKRFPPTDTLMQATIPYLSATKLVEKTGAGYLLGTEGQVLFAQTDPIINLYDKLRMLERRFLLMNEPGQDARRKLNNSYPMLVWGATLVTAPILFMWWNYSGKGELNLSGAATLYFYFIVFGLMISLPTYFIYRLSIVGMMRTMQSDLAIRLVSLLIVFACLIVTLMIINRGINIFASRETTGILLPYLIPVIVFSFVFRLSVADPQTSKN